MNEYPTTWFWCTWTKLPRTYYIVESEEKLNDFILEVKETSKRTLTILQWITEAIKKDKKSDRRKSA